MKTNTEPDPGNTRPFYTTKKRKQIVINLPECQDVVLTYEAI